MPALGEEFRSAREARGLTLSDVAEQIHIRSVYLNAIENEDWTSIGAPVYVRGFIRTYARFLGLDAEGAVQRFNESAPAERPTPAPAPTMAMERESTGPSIVAIVAGLVALVLVSFAGYEWWQFSAGGSIAHPVAALATPSPAASAQPAPTPVGRPVAAPQRAATPVPHHQLALHLSQRSWLRVIVDGHNMMEGIYPAGTTRTFTGSAADVRVGNAGGVTIAINGGAAKTLGHTGDVVEQRYTL